jgi:hypothetical protein
VFDGGCVLAASMISGMAAAMVEVTDETSPASP